MKVKKFFVKKRYLDSILNLEKEYEASIGYTKIKEIYKNDVVSIQNKKFRVEEVLIFKNFKEAFDNIDYQLIMPDIQSKEKAIKEMKQIYSEFKQEKYGVHILKLKYDEELQTEKKEKKKSKKKLVKRKTILKKISIDKKNSSKLIKKNSSKNNLKSNIKSIKKINLK